MLDLSMSVSPLPLGTSGAIEQDGTVTFGLWLPWVSAPDGNTVTVKVIHEGDYVEELHGGALGLTGSSR
jgi:maltooligosyltrehalose trehalohydrolase